MTIQEWQKLMEEVFFLKYHLHISPITSKSMTAAERQQIISLFIQRKKYES